MSDGVTAYPLSWPTGWKRTKHRQRSRFGKSYGNKPSVAAAAGFVEDQIDMLGAGLVAISTNVQTTLSGRPRSGQGEPGDPGVAVYFNLSGENRVLACDRWDKVGCNLWAIGKHIEALRGMDRWGVGSVEQAFTGYAALPADANSDWRTALGFKSDSFPTWPEVEGKFRALAFAKHPDRGGSDLEMARINTARDLARKELGG